MILYIANRGEIARRINRTAKRMSIPTVVGYAPSDESMPFVREATRAVKIDGDDPKSAYLDAEKILRVIQETGATHVHPGYGFLSERAEFAELLERSGIRFLGPRAETIRSLGDKMASRDFVRRLGIPLLPSYEETSRDDDRLVQEAERVGFPILIKPSAGGGGKGMSIARRVEEVREAVQSARRVAASSFRDDRLFLERFLDRARHIEVQIFGDGQGKVFCFGERECSLQRRYQKLVEETPCVYLPAKVREKIMSWSQKIGSESRYRSAGTVEWIWDGADEIFFLEVNSRLQVEHPVTEFVWGVDLVELQIREGLGESLSFDRYTPQGHAIEVRLCSEDPAQEFLPSIGKIHRLDLPEDLRVDFGYTVGNEVSPYFDSMLGKFISFSSDRTTAIQKLIQGLEQSVLFGPSTNRSYLIQLLKDERIQAGELYTQLLSEIPYQFDAASALKLLNSPQSMAWSSGEIQDSEEDLFSPWGATVQRKAEAFFEDWGDRRFYFTRFADWSERREQRRSGKSAGAEGEQGESLIRTPMPGKIVQVAVEEGATVQKGQLLLILEAMKMEHQIRAGMHARVKRMAVQTAQQVLPDDLLVELEPIKGEA